MVKPVSEAPVATLRYALTPDPDGIAAIEATFDAYGRMMRILEEIAPAGANLVALHEQAYETVRTETELPARLVTLGLRDRANYTAGGSNRRLPLDDKLFAIKAPTMLTIGTVRGRISVPFSVLGYTGGWDSPFPAQLVAQHGSHDASYEIHIAIRSKSMPPPEEGVMMHEGILARMGRLLAAIANQTIDQAEDSNKVALVKQAIREIDSGAEEARTALGKSRAEEFRLKSRQREIGAEVTTLTDKIRTAMAEQRDDLAHAGAARQIDLEAQNAALERALEVVTLEIEEQTKAFQAMLGARREAEARLLDIEKSFAEHLPQSGGRAGPKATAAAHAMAAVSRVSGVPQDNSQADSDLDELDRLHREKAIEARLAQIKAGR